MLLHSLLRLRRTAGVAIAILATLLLAPPGFGAVNANAEHEVIALFSEEMQVAASRLHWHGERLTEDTTYAAALTGLSWEIAWSKERPFWMAWGDLQKAPALNKRKGDYQRLVGQVQQLYAARDYRQAETTAFAEFSLDEIGCDADLKEAVGMSLLATGEPERAFPLLAAPFDARHNVLDVSQANAKFRADALMAAQKAGLTKEAIAFGLSLVLEPGPDAESVDQPVMDYLEHAGVDIDRVLKGILEAPDKLHGLPAFLYPAADLLAYRATPRLLPILLHMANSEDVYLRSRAVLGLGIVSYAPRPADPAGWTSKILMRPLREYGLSSSERQLIAKQIRDAANSDKFRTRSAAALALGLIGAEDSIQLLEKLAHDRAYLATEIDGTKTERLLFPVRSAAALSLERFGIIMPPGGGELSGKALAQARKGGMDKTSEHEYNRRMQACLIPVTRLDVAMELPQQERK
jgi:HEAT repeat protein